MKMEDSVDICFLVYPGVHILDLAGPCQAFYEVNRMVRCDYQLRYVSFTDKIITEQGIELAALESIDRVDLAPKDILFVAGVDFKSYVDGSKLDRKTAGWIRRQYERKVKICSICSGTLLLADAGILNGRKCTSHWKCVEYIKSKYAAVNVEENRIFVRDGSIYTSAGMTTGIDLALSLIEDLHGPIIASRVAREMVVYLRRTGADEQISQYLDYKTHFDPKIHKVQDIIANNLAANYSNVQLAEMVNMSERNLTRSFRKACGITIKEYKNQIRLELIRHLRHNRNLSTRQIASECGFKNPRQLYRILQSANMTRR